MNRLLVLSKGFYNRHQLLVNNTLSSGILMGIGDVCQQFFTGHLKENGWDWRSTLVMAGSGLTVAPTLHVFYYYLDKYPFGGTRRVVVMKKLFWDTLTNPPYSAMRIIVASFYEGKSPKDSLKEYTDKWWQVMKVDGLVTPCAMFFNFYFLPNKYRILYNNVWAIIYGSLLAHIKKMKEHKTEETK